MHAAMSISPAVLPARHGVMVACFGNDPALHYSLGQLLDGQRHAVGAIDDLVGDFLRQRSGYPGRLSDSPVVGSLQWN